MQRVPDDKRVEAADYAGVLQFSGDSAGGISRAKHDKPLTGRRHWHIDVEGEPSGDGGQQKKKDGEKLAHTR